MASKHRRTAAHGRLLAIGGIALTAAAVLAAGAIVEFGKLSFGTPEASGAPGSQSSPSASASSPPPAPTPTRVPKPLHLVSATPTSGAGGVPGDASVEFTFDAPVSLGGELPTITPQIAGTWSRPTPTQLRFTPSGAFAPDSAVTVSLPDTVTATDGGHLAAASSWTYHVADGSLLRLQQLLAELRYLPLTFTASTPEPTTVDAQAAMAFSPPQGEFAMRFASTPRPLAALWQPNALTPMTVGAIMTFENVHHLDVDGAAGPKVWAALLHDAATQTVDPQPYTWAWTTMIRPETLKIWSDGEFVFSSKANTGIPAAPTPKGSWPVFARYRSQTMKGTNPDGTKYNDPGVPYINYFHAGDAIHGFQRASYGSQQSLGCVELPYAAAAQVWDLIDYGTVVTVSS